jgi:hypothetical protein
LELKRANLESKLEINNHGVWNAHQTKFQPLIGALNQIHKRKQNFKKKTFSTVAA